MTKMLRDSEIDRNSQQGKANVFGLAKDILLENDFSILNSYVSFVSYMKQKNLNFLLAFNVISAKWEGLKRLMLPICCILGVEREIRLQTHF